MPTERSQGKGKQMSAEDLNQPDMAERADTNEGTDAIERPLATLVALRDQVQKLRIAENNRASAAAKEGHERAHKSHDRYAQMLHDLEETVEKEFKYELKDHPAWPWMQQVRGVGPALAAQILAHIDFERADTVSKLWRFAGLATAEQACPICKGTGLKSDDVECNYCEGKGRGHFRERAVKGERRTWNGRLKTTLYRWAGNQLRNNGPFEKTYRDARHRYETTRPNWTAAHQHLAALRVAEKLFLSMLWETTRFAMGLPVRETWLEQYGPEGHTFLDPYEFIGAEAPAGWENRRDHR